MDAAEDRTKETGQFCLDYEVPKEVAAFLNNLYKADLIAAKRWFDKRDYSISAARINDPEMTLSRYSKALKRDFHALLQVGDPQQFEICFVISGKLYGDGVTRFSWIVAPLNSHNYHIFLETFQESFKRKLC